MNSNIINVCIIENEKIYADSLGMVLSKQQDFEVTGLFYNAETALIELPDLQPEIILLDIDLGAYKKSGLDAIEEMLLLSPQSQILILTIFDEYEKVYEALQKGALGYILKSDSVDKIIDAIRDLKNGGSPMSPTIARKLTYSFYSNKSELQLLSTRETEIITLISKGFSEKEVAAELFLSPLTIKKHIANIYEKLQVNTRTAAINKLFRYRNQDGKG
ncbi:MAG: response regulator transcription factor [Saprospiraceae bacterium]|nr:response regulator transcription factor [Saprospiraceae bacterium]